MVLRSSSTLRANCTSCPFTSYTVGTCHCVCVCVCVCVCTNNLLSPARPSLPSIVRIWLQCILHLLVGVSSHERLSLQLLLIYYTLDRGRECVVYRDVYIHCWYVCMYDICIVIADLSHRKEVVLYLEPHEAVWYS